MTHPSCSTVSPISRRSLKADDPHSRLHAIESAESSSWPSLVSSISPTPAIFLSSLGTSRARAGGLEAQRKIDYDLNLNLAKAAKEAGVRVYVLISSSGVNKNSLIPYSKMKGELDEAVQGLGFEKTVLVKPGLLVGQRADSRPSEYVLRLIASFFGRVSSPWLKDWWAQDADVVGRAAVSAGLKCLDGSAPAGNVWVVGMSDVVRLGRTEWESKKGD